MQLRIASADGSISGETRDKLERHFRFALTRFTHAVSEIVVILSDESGPIGAPARRCTAVIRLSRGGSVIVNCVDAKFVAAGAQAAGRAARSVARQLDRNRQNRRSSRGRNSSDEFLEAVAD